MAFAEAVAAGFVVEIGQEKAKPDDYRYDEVAVDRLSLVDPVVAVAVAAAADDLDCTVAAAHWSLVGAAQHCYQQEAQLDDIGLEAAAEVVAELAVLQKD